MVPERLFVEEVWREEGLGALVSQEGGGSAGRSFDRPVDASPLLRFRAPVSAAHEVREKYVNIYFIRVYYKLSISISKIGHKVLKIQKFKNEYFYLGLL